MSGGQASAGAAPTNLPEETDQTAKEAAQPAKEAVK